MKLGSSNLNFLIIGGSVMIYLSIFLFASSFNSFDALTKETVLCNVRELDAEADYALTLGYNYI